MHVYVLIYAEKGESEQLYLDRSIRLSVAPSTEDRTVAHINERQPECINRPEQTLDSKAFTLHSISIHERAPDYPSTQIAPATRRAGTKW